MYILGISPYFHDVSVALIKDGQVVAAVEEERLNRIKHYGGFPERGIEYCLKTAGIKLEDVDYVTYAMQPFRQLLYQGWYRIKKVPVAPVFSAYHLMLRADICMNHLKVLKRIQRMSKKPLKVNYINHHVAHAATAFFTSSFDESVILSLDAWGEDASTTIMHGKGNSMSLQKAIKFPHSLGLLYAAITQHLGFSFGDEYKVMGLASYGKPTYYDKVKKAVFLGVDGTYKLNLNYFNYDRGPEYLSKRFTDILGPRRGKNDEITQSHMDIAASVQKLLEDTVMHILEKERKKSGIKNLCLTGGVALNCVMNGKILQSGLFENVYIPPSPHDGGLSLGAALYQYNSVLRQRRTYAPANPYLGNDYSDGDIKAALEQAKVKFVRIPNITEATAKLIADGLLIGWFQGRMEWGPRALGNRSILADATRKEMKDIVNSNVKFREDFRPFAPSVLAEHAPEYFKGINYSPFMLFIVDVKEDKKEVIPAVTHIDGTARPQTVSKNEHPLYWQLLNDFYKIKGVPVILNTSFNVKGEPVVCSPFDAIRCFFSTGLDYLVMGNYLVRK